MNTETSVSRNLQLLPPPQQLMPNAVSSINDSTTKTDKKYGSRIKSVMFLVTRKLLFENISLSQLEIFVLYLILLI